MKSITVEVKANIGDTVKIRVLELETCVLGLAICSDGVTYKVDYFHNGDRKSAWLNPHEFTTIPPQ